MSSPIEFRNGRPTFAGVGIRQDRRAPIRRSGEREPISGMVRRLVYQRDQWQCQHCRATPIASDPHRQSGPLHLDHIVPWSAGGSDRSDNLRTLCGTCNATRSNFVSDDDEPATPIVSICTQCLVYREPRYMALKEHDGGRFVVYCATGHHTSWAIDGWRIL